MSELVFRGNTETCLQHYGRTIKNEGKEGRTARAPMTKFTGANERTVRDWLLGRVPPVGKFMIRARYFLEGEHYGVQELERLDPLVCDLGRAIAQDRIGFDEAVQALGVPGDHYLLRILHGKIASMARATWVGKARQLLKTIGASAPAASTRSATKSASPVIALPGSRPQAREAVLKSLAALIAASTPLAEIVLSDDFTAEDRQELRTLAGDDGIYRFSNMMERLCTEMARRGIAPYARRAARR
ncbi:MAG: hypothetical protein HY474_01290 [Candidatus Sungbacteria bacterium]|uniref:Uncharacterized protein n=1 Tax=Candidatus Sungiibacteriota bacterium TaxID=2750080 RepID=A0A932YYD1_9BACT|nr:hypothetical protein [Candidatus Sungbacteria bacterium]